MLWQQQLCWYHQMAHNKKNTQIIWHQAEKLSTAATSMWKHYSSLLTVIVVRTITELHQQPQAPAMLNWAQLMRLKPNYQKSVNCMMYIEVVQHV